MTDHQPECFQYTHSVYHNGSYWCSDECEVDCICDLLRDFEQRVLNAAREAVAKEAERGPLYSVRNSGDAQRGWDAMSRHALAAIDALRGGE